MNRTKKRVAAPRYARELLPAPTRLVENGRVNYGTFDGAIATVNPLDAEGVFGFPAPRFARNLRLKEWQAFQLGNKDCFMLVVVYNQKAATLVQFMFHDRKDKTTLKYQRMVPCWQSSVASSLVDSRTRYTSPGFSIDIHNRLAQDRLFIDIAIDATGELPGVYAHFEAIHDKKSAAPMVVSQPFYGNRGMYSHKCLMPMRGTLCLGSRMLAFGERESFAIVDHHKGFYPYTLRYDWVTAAGHDRGGKLMGFNLTDNQVMDKERFNENCVWIGNRLHLLPPVTVSRPLGVEAVWLIRDAYGMVDLTFSPVVKNTIRLNLLLVKTDYHGPFGYVNGDITLSPGKKLAFRNYFGMGEQKYLRA